MVMCSGNCYKPHFQGSAIADMSHRSWRLFCLCERDLQNSKATAKTMDYKECTPSQTSWVDWKGQVKRRAQRSLQDKMKSLILE
ncbi:hypothetical protein LEMLEM_LOCUS15468 [Lemmus lemmus]